MSFVEPKSVTEHVAFFANEARNLTTRQMQKVHQIALALMTYSRFLLERFVTTYEAEPLLFFFGLDGPPQNTKETWKGCRGMTKVSRRGRKTSCIIFQVGGQANLGAPFGIL